MHISFSNWTFVNISVRIFSLPDFSAFYGPLHSFVLTN